MSDTEEAGEEKATAVCKGCKEELDAEGDCPNSDCELSPWYDSEDDEEDPIDFEDDEEPVI